MPRDDGAPWASRTPTVPAPCHSQTTAGRASLSFHCRCMVEGIFYLLNEAGTTRGHSLELHPPRGGGDPSPAARRLGDVATVAVTSGT